MTVIKLHNITQSYDENKILHNINYTFENSKFYTILGPSGCGKTTILKLIGGFIHPTGGEIFFENKKMNNVDANKRK